MKSFLQVGCGQKNKTSLKGFNSDDWKEIRFDIDKNANPDIVGTLTDMNLVETGSVDAVYSSHNIEHLYPHEVPMALKEFYRVLKDDGIVIITCPDLQTVCEAVVKNKLLEPLYQSPAGPISAIDILYGHRASMSKGNLYMAHKCGFTYASLVQALNEAGFKFQHGGKRPQALDLWVMAFKNEVTEEEIIQKAATYFP